ncbi:uncharacterized protein LOC125210725 isoform X2 [Salvia hispanica]|uniref:uncharacterized protein LOC125210725 isoform X2 n=1 Tax=Salvia hispanica TaxID=49212 RepID=UPI002009151A|nr:uncharacterized protein LOC125210725 isoform X2 [Salvia hispanica]
MWAGLILYWQDSNTVKKSMIASKARRSEPDGPGTGMRTHLGGSTSVTEKSLRMAAERGVSLKDVAYAGFKSLHTYKDGTYTCKKAANVDVQAIAATKGKNPNLSDIFINDVYGGKLDKKRRMFGIGNLAPNLMVYTSTESARATTLRDELRAELRGEIREEIRGEFRQDLDAQSVKISAMEEKMNRILMSQQSNFSQLVDDDGS